MKYISGLLITATINLAHRVKQMFHERVIGKLVETHMTDISTKRYLKDKINEYNKNT